MSQCGLSLLCSAVFVPCHEPFLLRPFKQPQPHLFSLLSLIDVDLNHDRFLRRFSLDRHVNIVLLNSLHLIVDLLDLDLDCVVSHTDLHLYRVVPAAQRQRGHAGRSHRPGRALHSDLHVQEGTLKLQGWSRRPQILLALRSIELLPSHFAPLVVSCDPSFAWVEGWLLVFFCWWILFYHIGSFSLIKCVQKVRCKGYRNNFPRIIASSWIFYI